MKILNKLSIPVGLAVIVFINILASILFFRIDLTSDKRYSISTPTRELVQNLNQPLQITIYLDGDLNVGFLRLKRAVAELMDELNAYSGKKIQYTFHNPSEANNTDERNANYEKLIAKGMQPTVIYEKDKSGKSMQVVVFPWAEVQYGNKKQVISLLKNIRGNSGEENLNISIESLEFEFTDVMRLLTRKKIEKIAFLEGYNELSEENTYDISTALNRYFQIDRGSLGNDATILQDYKALIIAGPQTPFSESDKYILDQYLMYGGRILWLVDGVRFSTQELSKTGVSPAMALDVNLADMLFRYGVRINPVLLQDEQCMLVPVNVAAKGTTPDFQPMPWHFAPLLLTSPAHPISRNIAPLSSTFVSAIDFVGDNDKLQRHVLLATSNSTRAIATPATINLEEIEIGEKFNLGFIPVAGVLEGVFESVFTHRIRPQNITDYKPMRTESVPTKQIVVANGALISNDFENGNPLPVGYDRYTKTQFGNRDFFINALLYLTDDEGWINLRNKELTLRMLNKSITRTQRTFLQWINVGLPLICLFLFGVGFHLFRKRKYTRY